MVTIWLDTDIGSDVDDAVAMLCAIRHPEMRLIGVSTVMHRVEINTWLAQEMLARAGMADVPVLPGAVAPLGVDYREGEWMPSHGRLAPDLPRLSPAQDQSRIDAVAQAMMSLPDAFHLVAVGPLTNIARLLDQHPAVSDRWLSTTCMGGRLEGEAEYNVGADAQAARRVVEQLSPRLVGLEASGYTLTREEAEAALDPSEPASAFLLDCYREYRTHAEWHADRENAPLTLFDPITLLSLAMPEAFDLQQLRVMVEGDGRFRLTDDGSPITYALSSDWAALKPLIVALLRGAVSAGAAS